MTPEQKRDIDKVEYDIRLVEQNLVRADQNIDIFSKQADKHRQQKVDYAILKRELEEKLAKLRAQAR